MKPEQSRSLSPAHPLSRNSRAAATYENSRHPRELGEACLYQIACIYPNLLKIAGYARFSTAKPVGWKTASPATSLSYKKARRSGPRIDLNALNRYQKFCVLILTAAF